MAQNEVERQSPLVKTLPPETDYLTYLTILEFNLDKRELPLLHRLLQDTRLTTNIGWDLVHLLLPLLPEAEECLMDVARLGNPRETVLKVAEMLEERGQWAHRDDDLHNGSGDEEGSDVVRDQRTSPTVHDGSGRLHGRRDNPEDSEGKFEVLLQMLCLLHPRIETKHPSRFLLTSLNAVLCAFTSSALAGSPSALRALLQFAENVSSPPNVPLSLRQDVGGMSVASRFDSAPDPEKDLGPTSSESHKNVLFLRSFLTRAMADFVERLQPVHECSPFAWTGRLLEEQAPFKTSVVRPALRDAFGAEQVLLDRDELSRHLMVCLMKSVGLKSKLTLCRRWQNKTSSCLGKKWLPLFCSERTRQFLRNWTLQSRISSFRQTVCYI